MQRLTPDECAAFAEVASAFLAQRERCELYREQATAAAGRGGAVPPTPGAAVAVELADKLYRLLLGLKQRHPTIPPIRFRRHLFLLTQHNGQVAGMHVLPEAGVAEVEG